MTDEERVERVKQAIGAKFAPAVNMTAPYAKLMLDAAARAAISAMEGETIPPALAAARFDQVSAGLIPPPPIAAPAVRSEASQSNKSPTMRAKEPSE